MRFGDLESKPPPPCRTFGQCNGVFVAVSLFGSCCVVSGVKGSGSRARGQAISSREVWASWKRSLMRVAWYSLLSCVYGNLPSTN